MQSAGADCAKLVIISVRERLFQKGQKFFRLSCHPWKCGDGFSVTIQPGKETYPGVHYVPKGGPWDLSAFGHVEAQFANLGQKPIMLNLRIDGQTAEGEWASNTESVTIPPGEAKPAKVFFGYTYGGKPGAKLKTSAITKIVVFVNKSSEEQKFRINAIDAGGEAGEKPPVKPENVRVKPENGVIYGGAVTLDPAQIEARCRDLVYEGAAVY